MKLTLKKIIVIACVGLLSTIICASDERKEDLCSASSSSSSSSSSSAPAIQTPTHPLAKIFPLAIEARNIVDGVINKISPDMKYILADKGHGTPKFIYDTSTQGIIIPELHESTDVSPNFEVLITKEVVPHPHLPFYVPKLYNFYDLEAQKNDPESEPFFSIEGYHYSISPDGHYAAIFRKVENQIVISVYDIQSHQHLDPQNVLFTINSGHLFFSSDSKKLHIYAGIATDVIIDIESMIHNPENPLRAEFTVNHNLQHSITFTPNFKYVALYNRDGTTLLYDVMEQRSNLNQKPLIIFPNPAPKLTFLGPDSKFMALTQDDKTVIHNLKTYVSNPEIKPLSSLPGGTPVLLSPDNRFIITNNDGISVNLYNISTKQLTKNIMGDNPLFSEDSRFLLATVRGKTIVYDTNSVMPLITVVGKAAGLSPDNRLLITKDLFPQKIHFYDVSFLNDPIAQGKLSLTQLTFIALLDTYYGCPISLAKIAQQEDMPQSAINTVLRHTLSTFPDIIKQAIIKKYNIIDAQLSDEEREELHAQQQKNKQQMEQRAGREKLIQKTLESKPKSKDQQEQEDNNE